MKILKSVFNLAFLIMMLSHQVKLYAQIPEFGEGNWLIRYNQLDVKEYFTISTSVEGLKFTTAKVDLEIEELAVFCHLRLEKPITGLAFSYELSGNAAHMPITLFDAAANELWKYDGQGETPGLVEIEGIRARGQLIFRIERTQPVELQEGWRQSISNIRFTIDNQEPVIDKDGFILVDNINEFRGYALEDNVRIRLKAGPYQIDRALCRQFIEFWGNNSSFDMRGVSFMVNTKLFRQSAVAQGVYDERQYVALALQGDNITMDGLYIETYGEEHGITSRNKIFNITGTGVTLKNTEVRTSGSNPWGYGSLYGIGGGDVRKMNGIRVAWPAKEVKLLGCKVHMRAMGHAIFIQGAINTLIEDCHVDGLLRTTSDILAETSGYAYDRDFRTRRGGYLEGVVLGEDGKILPGEMIALSEDGIRMYPQAQRGEETRTGSTTVINCTVTNMRRGICTGLSTAGDKVINCEVINCVATGFNVGNSDTLINCRANAKYGEALCMPYRNSKNASVELEVLDSRGGMINQLLAAINGTGHKVIIKSPDPTYIPDFMRIELSTGGGYAYYQRSAVNAIDIELDNQTTAKVLLLPGTVNPGIRSKGKVEDLSDSE